MQSVDRNGCPGLDSHFHLAHVQHVYCLILILLGWPTSGEKMFSVTIQRKHWFHALKSDVLHHAFYSYDMASHNWHLFRSPQHFLAEKVFIYVEEVKTYHNPFPY